MNLFDVKALLAMGPSPTGTQQDPKAQLLSTVGFMAIMIVMLYFVMIRPQQKKTKEHAQMLKNIRAGDKVITSGGIVGVVITVKDKTVSLRSADAKFEVTKGAITEITERSGDEKES
jgi:preprotein translocase subunit YajC